MNVFDLVATITLDSSGYDKGLDKAKSALGSVGGALKTGFTTVAKVGAAALTAASAGVVALTKASVDGYAEYEQMVGGVKKLYGNMGQSLEEYAKTTGKTTAEVKGEWLNLEKAQNMVLENAKNSYKNAGMSANQYMEMATSFSASLISSLNGDTVKAAKQTDIAMQAISDNFNTFGGDIGMIQGAFQGFAKQNYTMLDNLKLGYGGTKKEMERLIDDANEYAKSIGQASDLTMDSFSDIVTAIELIQKKQNIWGTTSREATTTIAGSLGMMKAAWSDLVTGMADPNADIGALIENMVDSASVAAENLIPAIERGLEGVGRLVENIAPILSEKLPELIENTLPSILRAATSLISGIVSALPSLISVLLEQVPTIVSQFSSAITSNAGQILSALGEVGTLLLEEVQGFMWDIADYLKEMDWSEVGRTAAAKIEEVFDFENSDLGGILYAGARIIENLVAGLAEAAPELVPAAMDIVANFGEFLMQEAPELMSSGIDLVIGVAEGITDPDALENIGTAAIDLIMSLADGLVDNLPKLIDALPTIIDNLIQGIWKLAPKLATAALELTVQLQFGLIKSIPQLLAAIPEIIGSLVGGIIDMGASLIEAGAELISDMKQGIESLDPAQWGRDLIDKFVDGISSAIGRVRDAVRNIADTVRDYLGFSEPKKGPLSNFHTYAPDMMNLFAKGIRDNEDVVADQLEKSLSFDPMYNVDVNGKGSSSNKAYSGGMVQNITVNAPTELDPSEIARQTRNATRDMVLQLRMA